MVRFGWHSVGEPERVAPMCDCTDTPSSSAGGPFRTAEWDVACENPPPVNLSSGGVPATTSKSDSRRGGARHGVTGGFAHPCTNKCGLTPLRKQGEGSGGLAAEPAQRILRSDGSLRADTGSSRRLISTSKGRGPFSALSLGGLVRNMGAHEGVKKVKPPPTLPVRERSRRVLMRVGTGFRRERWEGLGVLEGEGGGGSGSLGGLWRLLEGVRGWGPGERRRRREERDGEALCVEIVRGVKMQYRVRGRARGKKAKEGFLLRESQGSRDMFQKFLAFAKTWVLPEGFPESVAPSYAPYMRWRAIQYFFGGAMGVFTTRSLLHAVGVSRGASASTAVAVNWAIKDGAGRLGKMAFARHGKKFDCDLKQLRFAGDLLMELGAGVELATMAFPQFFLPLACAANVAKNVAAVTATSTRAPIYKAFARRENIGDVTAKGESISNLSDLLGTGFGILLSRRNPSLIATFCVLSCGYLFSSYNEVKSISVPTLNRARFHVAVRTFLESGRVPSPPEANQRERILVPPWAIEQPMELGARVFEAFATPDEFQATSHLFKNEKYLVTYRSCKRRAYVVLKDNAGPEDVLRGAFQAHVLLHLLHGSAQPTPKGFAHSLPTHIRSLLPKSIGQRSGGPTEPIIRPSLGAYEQAHDHGTCPAEAHMPPRPLSSLAVNAAGRADVDRVAISCGDGSVASSSSASSSGLPLLPSGELGRRTGGGILAGVSHGKRGRKSLSEDDVAAAITASCLHTRERFDSFSQEAASQGWTLAESLLNPGDARLCVE